MVSLIPGKSRIIDIDKGPVTPMHLRGGTKCYWLKWDNDWWGGGDNRPVNPVHLREDTSCFSLKRKNDWWVCIMNSLMKHYWWLRIVLILRVSLVCDCRHRLLVANQEG